MIFDLSYERAAWFIPLPRETDLKDGLANEITELSIERRHSLAKLSGKEVAALDGPPFKLEKGCRYIAWLPTDKPDIFHSVVVDETGTVFDPDPDNQDVHKSWTEYSFKAVLEFHPMT